MIMRCRHGHRSRYPRLCAALRRELEEATRGFDPAPR